MMFPIFNMPCLHNHHQPPHVFHSRAPHDGEISSPAATGLAVGLILVALVVAVLVYFWCWRQQEPRNHRREARHRRDNQRDQAAGQNAAGNGDRAAAAPEVQQAAQRQGGAAQGQQECPLPAVPLSLHHHQHDDKHFHGDHFHDHHHEGDHILDCPDPNNGRTVQNNSHRHRHPDHHHHHQHRHHHHRHHRFNRTNHLIIPQDPLAEIERLFRPPSPGLPDITQADLEAILNGLDVPLPNDAAQRNANAQEQGTARREDESRERGKKRHHHHHRHRRCHRRQKRVVIY
ncbi:hypothetical protein BBK36DRAFT_1160283 [Trichoderma citrinoviride]|uniref:Uncharacterized protein n=1 Tax=Trichoderma citrinoviride TaxID=58853 RepID=A0A2T4B752_9HYPO|nr:hypothetical protein BBK36DRAFT_1160283 [Trichoderma citrinoviride]PTB65059.1 hypothetical protein BBK36DRAFT_1160283 [Trichoderma citrinoviride]